jgi:hypothetical protein
VRTLESVQDWSDVHYCQADGCPDPINALMPDDTMLVHPRVPTVGQDAAAADVPDDQVLYIHNACFDPARHVPAG